MDIKFHYIKGVVILSVRSAITCDFSDLGSTGMGSGKADTAVETLDHLAILEFTI